MIDFDSNVMLVYSVFNKNYKAYRHLEDDLVQEGLLGLWKACNTFDPEKGAEFSTYAVKCIKNEMGMFLRKIGKSQEELSLDRPLNTECNATFLHLVEEVNVEEDDSKSEAIQMLIDVAKETGNERLIELKLQGMKQVDIAKELHVHPATISERMRFLYEKVRNKLNIIKKTKKN